ncbi:hypothetical protein J7J12_02325 [bacterium]|nr:hypothetical protein [bacterium]
MPEITKEMIDERIKNLYLEFQDPEGRADRIPGNIEVKIERLRSIRNSITKKENQNSQ